MILKRISFEKDGKKNEEIGIDLQHAVFEDGKCVIKDAPLLVEGRWNGLYFPAEVIQQMVTEYNSRDEDIRKCSIYHDHIDMTSFWLGYVENIRYDEERLAAVCDYYFVEAKSVEQLKAQKEAGGGFWGISPTIQLDEHNYTVKTAILVSASVVTGPAQGEETKMFNKEEKSQEEEVKNKKLAKEEESKDLSTTDGQPEIDETDPIAVLESQIEDLKKKKDDEEDDGEKEKMSKRIDSLENLLVDLKKAKEEKKDDDKKDEKEDDDKKDEKEYQADKPAIQLPSTDTPYEYDKDKKLYRKEVMRCGVFQHPNDPTDFFVTTRERMDKWVENFNKNLKRVPVPLTHTDDPEKNSGWVEKLERVEDSMYAYINFTSDAARELVDAGTIGDTSIMIDTNFTDDKGERYGEVIDHICLTNNPHIQNLKGFEKVGVGFEGVAIKNKYIKFEEVSMVGKTNKNDSVLFEQVNRLESAVTQLAAENAELKKKEERATLLGFESRVGKLVEDGIIPKGMESRVANLVKGIHSSKISFEKNGEKVSIVDEIISVFEAMPKISFEKGSLAKTMQSEPGAERVYLESDDFADPNFANLVKEGKIARDMEQGGKAYFVDGRP